MKNSKLILRYFSESSKSNFPTKLNFYKEILDKTSPEFLFPRSFKTNTEFSNYLHKEDLSSNIQLKNKIQIDSINRAVFTPAWDLLARGGKGWRPLLGLIIANYFKLDITNTNKKSEKTELLFHFLHLVELLHNASLIIDDVEDQSEMRRGKPCVHLIYGQDIAINAGISLLYFPAYKLFKLISDPKIKIRVAEVYLEEMSAIHTGQAWDIEMKINNRLPCIDDYTDTVICKTGVMPRLMVKLIKILVDDEKFNPELEKFMKIMDSLSIAFQIRDDVLNITDSVLAKGKGFLGEDIYEGKLTLMVLHCLNSGSLSVKSRLESIIKMKTKDEELIREAINIMAKCGSIDYANTVQNNHVDFVKKTLLELKNNDKDKVNCNAAEDVMLLTDYLINRNI
jgi:geranylgeranyl pyrophosphate synthase